MASQCCSTGDRCRKKIHFICFKFHLWFSLWGNQQNWAQWWEGKKHLDVCSLVCRMKRAAHQSCRVWIESTFSFCVWNLWHSNMQNYFTYQHKIVVITSGSAHSEVPQVRLNCAITVTSLSGQLSGVNWMSESSTLMSEGGTTTGCFFLRFEVTYLFY